MMVLTGCRRVHPASLMVLNWSRSGHGTNHFFSLWHGMGQQMGDSEIPLNLWPLYGHFWWNEDHQSDMSLTFRPHWGGHNFRPRNPSKGVQRQVYHGVPNSCFVPVSGEENPSAMGSCWSDVDNPRYIRDSQYVYIYYIYISYIYMYTWMVRIYNGRVVSSHSTVKKSRKWGQWTRKMGQNMFLVLWLATTQCSNDLNSKTQITSNNYINLKTNKPD